MSHDDRFPGVTERDLQWRRLGALIALVALTAFLTGLALGAPEIGEHLPADPPPTWEMPEITSYPVECDAVLTAYGRECLYY